MKAAPSSSARSAFVRYGLGGGAVALGCLLRLALSAWVGPGLPAYLTFFPAVMVAALLGGLGPGLLATGLAALAVDYWILAPGSLFSTDSLRDTVGLILFSSMGAGISTVAHLYQRARAKAAAYDREAALRESQERLAAFAAASFEGIVQSEGRRIVDCNEQFARMAGYSVAELSGAEIAGLIVPEDRERVLASIQQGVESMREHGLLRKDGTRIFVETHGRPVSPGSAGRLTVIRDITDRKQAEQALQRANTELERSNRELEQFAYVVSHDLQEPLRAVSGYVQLLGQRYADKLNEKAQRYIAQAREGADRMHTLIQDLLAFSRVGTQGKAFDPTNLEAVLDQVLRDFHARLQEAGAQVTRDHLPTLTVDRTQIGQLFQNLIGNALKFRAALPPEIHIGAQKEDGQWRLSVRDNGIGIEPQYFDQIFQVFQRLHTHTQYPGTGIGLAICKKIVERHGGRIWVESEPGRGTTFYFTIQESLKPGISHAGI